MSSFLKQFASTITNEQDTYDGYYEINLLNNEPHDQLDKIILDRTNKYKNKSIKTPETKTKNDTKCVIFNDIIENINDTNDTNGVFKIKTNNSQLKTCTFFIETRHILAFNEFHDCIKSISLQRKKKYYHYMISIFYPPKNKPFELFNYKIKYDKNTFEQQYNKIKINYSVKRTAKTIFDNQNKNTSYTSAITKIKTKLINQKNKTKNIIFDNNLIWIETFEINIQSLFDTMCSTVDILIPIRSLKNKNLKLLTFNSNLLKWGNISHVEKGNFTFVKWSLAFIKGLSSHSVVLQLSIIANNQQICEKIVQNKYQKFTNYPQKEYIFDSKIKTKWNKQYFTISGMKIDKYYADPAQVKSCWIRQITHKKIVFDDENKELDEVDDEKEEMLCFDMNFLNNLKTMKASIITLDRRQHFLRMKQFSDISWRKKEENNILYINSKIYIDVVENECGGIVNIKNNISGLNFFKFCVKMKDELLLITSYHSSIFLVEYKLKKTTISENKCYAYIYYFYVFAMPYGKFELFKYKRLQNKKQSLITLKCNKYIADNEDNKENKNENEWRGNYRLTLNSHFSSDCAANDIRLTVPVFINNLQKGNIKIKNMSSSLLQKGKLKYFEHENCLLWSLTNFTGKQEISRNIQFKLSKTDNEIELKYKTVEDKNNVLVFGECEINSIEIEDFCISGIIISGCKCIDNEKLKYNVWIRYNTIIND